MCGFTGIWFATNERVVDSFLLKEMSNVIKHRGPDDEGFLIDKNIGFGFRRLSIIDLNYGHQPMCDSHGQAWIVFNGEIYNYKSLRKELESRGRIFKTKSDTEVILNSYLEYGIDFVSNLRGMFSFAIWDINKKRIVLGRDRFGIKPLYYLLDSEHLVFGSEMKSILKGNFSKKEIDWQAVDSYFSYGYILSPLTIYNDIRKLSPGHILVIESVNNHFSSTLKRYWKPEFCEDTSITFEDYKKLIREKLNETVNAHLVSDVPVGAFLSGGIDSNVVVSEMIKIYPEKVKTFSIGFNNPRYNEAKLAKRCAEFYGTDHTELYLKPESAEIIDKIVDIYDEPFADSSAIPTYFVAKLAAEKVKVVLSGDGGDEFFAGYESYQRMLSIHKYRRLIRNSRPIFKMISGLMPLSMKGKRFLYSLSKNPEHIYAYTMQVNEMEKKSLFHPDVINKIENDASSRIKLEHLNDNTSNYISRLLGLDISTYMVDDILTKVDRASMANSLEVRVPIIDHEFFELAAKIPSQMKIKGSTGKFIFRESMKEQIPPDVYTKSKSGFTIPINDWFDNNLTDYYVETLKKAENYGILNTEYLKPFLKNQDLGSQITRVWPILVFTKWMERIHNI
jgi:asparagine synthase (glutamine-hydrolysing)